MQQPSVSYSNGQSKTFTTHKVVFRQGNHERMNPGLDSYNIYTGSSYYYVCRQVLLGSSVETLNDMQSVANMCNTRLMSL
jgi:hypothetical protein